MMIIDKLSYSSKLRENSPTLKMSVAVMTIVTLLLFRSIPCSMITVVMMGGLTLIRGKTSFRYYLRLFLIPTVFLLFSSFAIIWTVGKAPVLEYSLSIGHWYVSTSRRDLLRAVEVVGLSLGSISCLYFLILSTPMTDILGVLKRFHCPDLLMELMVLMYRFIFLVFDLAAVITIAQNCRLGNQGYRARMKGMAEMLSAVFIKSLRKSRAMYDAMEARGYDGTVRVLEKRYQVSFYEIAAAVFWELCLIMIFIIEHR